MLSPEKLETQKGDLDYERPFQELMSIGFKRSTVPVKAVIIVHLASPVHFLAMGPVRLNMS